MVPLAWSAALGLAAETHSALVIATNTQSHQLPGEASLGARISATGYNWSNLRENVYVYAYDMLYAHAGFFIDWGYDDSGVVEGTRQGDWQSNGEGIQDGMSHRNVILAAALAEIGIGVIAETDSTTNVGPYVVTQDFGRRPDYKPQLLGVVIDDADGDRFYDIGEGLGGITVTATATAGGGRRAGSPPKAGIRAAIRWSCQRGAIPSPF